MNRKTLLLNKNYLPAGIVSSYQRTVIAMFSGSMCGIDIHYDTDENGNVDLSRFSYFNVIKNIEDWMKLEIRPYDEFINSPDATFRIPSVAICTNYDKVPFVRAEFPTSQNIYRRDNYICQYTGKKLSQKELSIDHVIPRSRCAEFGIENPDKWDNMVACDRALNSWKSNRLPEECGLKLINKPKQPNNGLTYNIYSEDWKQFIGDFK